MEGGREEMRERREGGVGKEDVVSMQELVQSATVTMCCEAGLPSTQLSSMYTFYTCKNPHTVSYYSLEVYRPRKHNDPILKKKEKIKLSKKSIKGTGFSIHK